MSRKGLAYLFLGREPQKGSTAQIGAGKALQEWKILRALWLISCATIRLGRHRSCCVLAFGELLAFVSLLVPAWGALVAIGALIGVSGISFWPVWLAGGIGAALGDWVSYWFGFSYKEHVAQMWPLSRYPGILPRGEAFVKKWGVPSIFIGRFFGPLRASVPLAAGIFEMSYWPFQIANFVSALVWSAVLLLVGDVMGKIAEWLWRVA